MVSSNLGNLASIVILQFVYNLALFSVNSRQKKKVLQVFVVAEWRVFNDDLL